VQKGLRAVTKVHPASRADFASHPRSTSDNSAAPPSGTPRPRRLLPTIHRNVKCGADLTHAPIAETSNPLHQGRNRNTFDRIKVDSATATDLIVPWLEHHLAGENCESSLCTVPQGSSQPRNGRIARKAPPRVFSVFLATRTTRVRPAEVSKSRGSGTSAKRGKVSPFIHCVNWEFVRTRRRRRQSHLHDDERRARRAPRRATLRHSQWNAAAEPPPISHHPPFVLTRILLMP